MDRNKIVPAICVVLSVAEILFAQPPFRLRPSPIPTSWEYSNEILGSSRGPAFRPPPGLLIAGHGPPGARPPRGPLHAGSRLIPRFANSPPGWPSQGLHIQRAKETSHFEYDMFPDSMNLRRPPRLRPSAGLHSPISTLHTVPVPPAVMRILGQETMGPVPSPSQNARTDRPLHTLGPYPSPIIPQSSPQFQKKGFHILSDSDMFIENAGTDAEKNLVVGSDILLDGNHYTSNLGSSAITHGNMSGVISPSMVSPTSKERSTSDLQITLAKEHPIFLSEGTSSEGHLKPKPTSPTTLQMQMHPSETASSFASPHFQRGPASSHAPLMFTDPNEAIRQYSVHDEGYSGPPPPFHASGNSIVQPQSPLQSDPNQVRQNFRPLEKQEPRQHLDNSIGGHNTPPSAGNRLRQQTSSSQVPMMMVPVASPLSANRGSDGPSPSSDEVQRALGILTRHATKQIGNMGVGPQQMGTQFSPTFTGQRPSPHQPQQSTPIPVFIPASVTPPENAGPQSSPSNGPSVHFTTTEPVDVITVSGGQTEESSPFPAYGTPGLGSGGISGSEGGGWSSGGGGGGYGGGGGGGAGAQINNIIGSKFKAIQTINSAISGGFSGFLNAGLSAIGSLQKAKGDIVNSLKIPTASDNSGYGPPDVSSHYGPTPHQQTEGPVTTLINGVRDVVGGIAGTVAQTGRAAVGIGLSKNEFVKNHFAIKGQALTQTVSKKIANKNQYFQNVLKHVQSIFNSARTNQGGGGWGPH